MNTRAEIQRAAGVFLLIAPALMPAQTPFAAVSAMQSCDPFFAEPMPPPPGGLDVTTVFVPLTSLARTADLIVVGTVVAFGPLEIDDAHSFTVTYSSGPFVLGPSGRPEPSVVEQVPQHIYYRDVVLAVEERLKGEGPLESRVNVRISSYPNSATFVPCERAVVLLARSPSQPNAYTIARKVTITDHGTVFDADGLGAGVPLPDFLRFLRSAISRVVPDYPRDPRVLEEMLANCPPPRVDAGFTPNRISFPEGSGGRLTLGLGSLRFGELAALLGQAVAAAEPSGLDVSEPLRARFASPQEAFEITFDTERTLPGGGPYPTDRIHLYQSGSLTGASEVHNPGAPAGTAPMAVTGVCHGYGLHERLGRLVRALVSFESFSALIVAVGEPGRELTLLTAEHGLIVGHLDDASEVRNETPFNYPTQVALTPERMLVTIPDYSFATPNRPLVDESAPPDAPLYVPSPTSPPPPFPPPSRPMFPGEEIRLAPPATGHAVTLAGRPDPERAGTVYLSSLRYGTSVAANRARGEADNNPAPRFVEYGGRGYAPELAGPADLAPYLTATGERIAAGGGTTYAVGAEVFRLRGAADDVLVLRQPGSAGERLAANRRLIPFRYLGAAADLAAAPERIYPVRLRTGEIPIYLERTVGTSDRTWHLDYRGGIYQPTAPLAAARPEEIELVDRFEQSPTESSHREIGLVEVYRWRDPSRAGELLLNVVARFQLGEYEIWRVWDPPPERPRLGPLALEEEAPPGVFIIPPTPRPDADRAPDDVSQDR